MRHIVMIKSKNPEKFNYCKFGTYTDKDGRTKELVDINDKVISGYEMFQAVVSLDINRDYDKRLYEFLKDHPLIQGKFTIEDVSSEQQRKAENSLHSAKAITTASQLSENDMRDLALLMGIDSSLEEMLLRAKIIDFASNNSEKFISHLEDIDKEHRVFLKKASDKNILTKVNGVWKHGTLNIGLNDDQAIVWLKDNGDVYALLKHQLRTGKIEKIEEEKVEKQSTISNSTLSELENDVQPTKVNS